jgi:DNA-binding HxlR family transcriptional regulator
MTNRSYNQFCAMSYALDLIGDRWTMLILRELLYGPRRYTDLKQALPGIVSNLLAGRLRELEEKGLIAQRQLPPPASSIVYELTDYGQTTREIILPITRWGLHLMSTPEGYAEHTMSTAAVIGALEVLFNPKAGEGESLVVDLYLNEDVFQLTLGEGRFRAGSTPVREPDLALRTTPKRLAGAVAGMFQGDNLDGIELKKGSSSEWNRFMGFFSPPS